MADLTDSAHEAFRFSPAAWKYRGFTIHTKKIAGMPLFYATVYRDSMETPGFKVERDDEPGDSREKVVEWAKWEIDDLLNSEGTDGR